MFNDLLYNRKASLGIKWILRGFFLFHSSILHIFVVAVVAVGMVGDVAYYFWFYWEWCVVFFFFFCGCVSLLL